jgi:DNA polymerase elongation subunit (family B)
MLDFDFQNILFLDIETVPQYPDYKSAPETFQKLWNKKAERLSENNTLTPEEVFQKAGIYSEFGKIICISVAYMYNDTLFVKSFFSEDNEAELLVSFADMLNNYNKKNYNFMLCAHNGKEFDYPYIARRMLIHGVPIPDILNTVGKKPWEVKNIDTMELWKFGDYKNFTSLNTLAYIFHIPTPKDDIDGSMVYDVFYNEKGLQRIVEYCEKDVIAVAQLLRRYSYLPLIPVSQIEYKK